MDKNSENRVLIILKAIWFNLQLRLFTIVGILFFICLLLGIANLYIWYQKEIKRKRGPFANSVAQQNEKSDASNKQQPSTRTKLFNFYSLR